MDPALVDGRPEVCPKGHPIWWFAGGTAYGESANLNRRPARWWGICRGTVAGRRFEVAGSCRHTWYWHSEVCQLATLLEVSPEVLIEPLRTLAYEGGRFRACERGVDDDGDV